MSSESSGAAARRFGGMIPPIPSPLRDGALDVDSLKSLLDYLGEHVAGVLAGGSVGEVSSLTVDERIILLRAIKGHSGDRHVVAFNISSNAVEDSRRLADAAGDVGAELLMLSCPNYFTNTTAMLEAYFGAVSEFASADICLYDNPVASNTALTVDDIKRLCAAAPRITHVKVTDTALGKVEALRAETDLTVLAGDDAVLWHHLRSGVEGGMVAMPMIEPERVAQMWTAFSGEDHEEAYKHYQAFTPFIHLALGAGDYPAIIKRVLHERGVLASPEVRLPLLPTDERRWQEITPALSGAA